ncbi:VOC family protein [Terrarubrum flagellatum]|uniref:VOC family protein n=1 Tax=Terrirubrum flagellatum TaxID=2895980 RepID=UPI0031455A8D
MTESFFTLHHNSIYVADVDRSAEFYARVLGLTEIPNRVGRSHIRWFDLDGLRSIHLIGGEQVARERQFSTHFALATKRFDEFLARLAEHGVVHIDLARKPGGVHVRADGVRQTYFQDPDGHWIEINDAVSGP